MNKSEWKCYIISDLATWTGAAGNKPYTPIEFYDSYEQAAARFKELRAQPYNSENLPGARLAFGVQREDPPSAADLLHVRQGKNYLVDDFTRMASLNQSPEGMDILRQMRKDLGFDRVRAYEPGAMEPKDVTFSRWKHPLKLMLRKSVLGELRKAEEPKKSQKSQKMNLRQISEQDKNSIFSAGAKCAIIKRLEKIFDADG